MNDQFLPQELGAEGTKEKHTKHLPCSHEDLSSVLRTILKRWGKKNSFSGSECTLVILQVKDNLQEKVLSTQASAESPAHIPKAPRCS